MKPFVVPFLVRKREVKRARNPRTRIKPRHMGRSNRQLHPLGENDRQMLTSTLEAALVFGALVLVFTLLGVILGPPETKIGSTRPADTIPSHLGALAGFGLLLGVVAAALYGRRGLPVVVLIPTLTVMLDLDHLPVYLGVSQPIRPAHSVLFIITVLTITAITIKRLDINLAVLSAFLGHLGIDTGQFAPFSPASFSYVPLDPYKVPFLVGAAAAAIAAGVVLRRERRKGMSERGAGSS